MANLYDITERYINIQELIENEEIDPILLENALGDVEDEFNEKMLNITKLTKNLEGYISMVDEEEKRLKEKKRILKNKLESLKEYAKFGLINLGIKKVDLGIFKLSLRKSEKVEIEDLKAIPEEFLKYKEPDVNKIEIKKAIKEGKEVAGARIVENESLQIK